jgi:ribose transport system ATP-binding protein
MEGVSKSYGGFRALEKAGLIVEAGRVHAVLGENGAGKSTLIKVMAGVVDKGKQRSLQPTTIFFERGVLILGVRAANLWCSNRLPIRCRLVAVLISTRRYARFCAEVSLAH